MDGFLRHVCGDGYRAVLDQVIPDAFDEALDEADLFFQAEMPAVQQWSFGPGDAERISQPVLNVLGAESAPRFAGRKRARTVLVPAGRTPLGARGRAPPDGAKPAQRWRTV